VHCGVFAERKSQQAPDLIYIGSCLRALAADVVCLQEFMLPAGNDLAAVERLQADAGYAHAAFMPLSTSHLGPGNMGLLTLSRLPIQARQETRFDNPGLSIQRSGQDWKSHDKGALRVTVTSAAGPVDIVNLHLFPFTLFATRPLDLALDRAREDLRRVLAACSADACLVCGDLNVASLDEFLPGACSHHRLREVIHVATRPGNRRHDQILHSEAFSATSVRVVHTLSDHHACMVDLMRGLAAAATAATRLAPADAQPVAILHLSDLHFGPGEAEPGEWKTPITFAKRETQRDAFVNFVQAGGLPRCPDFVVVSGDVTVRGDPQGWQLYLNTVEPLIRAGWLPNADRFVLVPGNHDVTRTTPATIRNELARWQPFVDALGGRHARAWIPAVDKAADEMLRQACNQMLPGRGRWGGVLHETVEATGEHRSTAFPFLFDRDRRVLFYAFNSASISGNVLPMSASLDDDIKLLRALDGNSAKAMANVVAELERLRQIDPARIDPRELALFELLLAEITKRDERGLADVLKVAVLHHHVTSIFPEEVKSFELMLNAGQFKRQLRDEGFHLILHGHKHWGEPFVDTAVSGGGAHVVVSGGTIAGPPPYGKGPGFFWLEWQPTASELSARFVDILTPAKAPVAFQGARKTMFRIGHDETKQRLRVLPGDAAPPQRIDLRNLFRDVEEQLLHKLRRVAGGAGEPLAVGWSHRLKLMHVSTIATAYGLKILALTSRHSPRIVDIRPRAIGTLLAMRCPDGGWSASSQGQQGRPEATCWVLEALHAWQPDSVEVAAAADVLERLLDRDEAESSDQHTLSAALALRTLSRIRPASPWVPRLATRLVDGASRSADGSLLCWGEQLNDLRRPPADWSTEGSPVHTAHAVLALLTAWQADFGVQRGTSGALAPVRGWLLAQRWEDREEQIRRSLGAARYELLTVNHFTAPWVVVALLRLDCPPRDTRLAATLHELLDQRHGALWNWGTVEVPIWATHDALMALSEAALAGSVADALP
jgi:endonuclease/exonuclease/phosphatase family metal-dependent hydrolase/3',5'-cyclic AMP phosphodiesterase CpdA